MDQDLMRQPNIKDRSKALKVLLWIFLSCIIIIFTLYCISYKYDGLHNSILNIILILTAMTLIPLTLIIPITGIRQLFFRKELNLSRKAKNIAIIAIFAIIPDLIAIIFIGYVISAFLSGSGDSW